MKIKHRQLGSRMWSPYYRWLCASLIGTLMVATTAMADLKIYPATICKIFATDRNLSRHLSFSQFGRLENRHPSRRIRVVCPILRDKTSSVKKVEVRGYDGNPLDNRTGRLRCILRSNVRYGTRLLRSGRNPSQQIIRTRGSFVGLFTWNFQNLRSNRFSSSRSIYTLTCDIPPRIPDSESFTSYISSLAVTE